MEKTTLTYSLEIASDILERFHQKGWNLYSRDDRTEADEVIRRNLAESLKLNVGYVLLPVANDPRDPEQVFDSLEVLAQKLNRENPTIRLKYGSRAITGITLKEDKVKIHGENTLVSYTDFMEALDSVIQTR